MIAGVPIATAAPDRDPTVVGRVGAVTTIRLITAAHFGGGEGDATDAQLLRDADGAPFIPGASLAGACRAFLRGRPAVAPDDLELLFGGREPGSASVAEWGQSLLSVADAFVVGEVEMALRDRVRIDAARGAAADQGKFDFEALEPGARFAARLDLTLRRCDEGRQERLRTLFNALLDALQYGDIRIGAHTRRGLGRIESDPWRTLALDFRRAGDVLAWLRDDAPPAEAPERWGDDRHATALTGLGTPPYCLVSARLALAGALLVRAAPAGALAQAPDVVQFHSGDRPVVPGSSLAGVLRHRALRICRTLTADAARGDALVDDLFGPGFSDTGPPVEHRASRLRVDEAVVEGSRAARQTRIAIDRFTGGTLATALLEEQPEWPAEGEQAGLTVRMRLEPPRRQDEARWDAERGLMLLLLKDLCTGDLPVGGGAAVGRGVLRGVGGRIELGGATVRRWDWQADASGAVAIGDHRELERWVQALDRYLNGAPQ